MEDIEFEDFIDCHHCGATIARGDVRSYVVNETVVLCENCATLRGGVYEAMHDRWTIDPDVSDLPDERRPHA
jgi:hypothetical protein